MKYKILNADNPVVLQSAVTAFLSEGWDLQGGVSVAMAEYEHMNRAQGYTETSGSIVFAQALIKRDTTSEPPPEDPHSDSSTPEGTSP